MSASEKAGNVFSGNTIPLAMIGFGAAWLLFNRTSHGDHADR